MKTLEGTVTRPTSDRVKESLYNIIAPLVLDAEVIDVFAGTGSLGIEALSRGAKSAVFIDKNPNSISIIKDNLKYVKLDDKAEVYTGEACFILDKFSGGSRKFDIIFLDPPYGKNLIEVTLKCIIKNDIIKEDGIIVAERNINDEIPEKLDNIELIRNQKYRDTILSFYQIIK